MAGRSRAGMSTVVDVDPIANRDDAPCAVVSPNRWYGNEMFGPLSS
jgi:hypothetical protein